MAAPRIRSVILQGDDGPPIPWDAVREKLAELLRFLASALQPLVDGIREWAASMEQRGRSALAAALPAAAVVALVVLCCCCCGYYAAGGGRRRRGPDGEEAYGHGGPVVTYGGRARGGYRGGIFSMHPNKPIV
ncbi:hypothetical protein ACUV84_036971 [Puccinellia chinampoensis]